MEDGGMLNVNMKNKTIIEREGNSGGGVELEISSGVEMRHREE